MLAVFTLRAYVTLATNIWVVIATYVCVVIATHLHVPMVTNDSVSLPLDLDLDEDVSTERGHQVVLYSRNLSQGVRLKDQDYFLRPPYFPLVMRPKSDDYLFSTKFYSKMIYVTKDGHLLADSKDVIMTHFKRQLELCHKIYTSHRRYFLYKTINKHHEFTQLANILWDRYKEIEISLNKIFVDVPFNLKYKMKQYHIDEKRIKLEDWWNIENTLDVELTTLFNDIRYDLYKAFDMFDTELHLTCFHFDENMCDFTSQSDPTVATIQRIQFNDSLVESDEDTQ